MTVQNIIPATPSNRKQWKANQCVTIGCGKRNQLLVTSRQSRSTPGMYTEVYLKQNTCYCVSVSGVALGHTKAFVFVYNPSTKQRLIPNYTFLPSKCFGCVDVEFTTPRCANEHLCIWLGVLFTSPCNGQQYCLQEIRIGHSSPHNEKHSHPPHTPQCPVPKHCADTYVSCPPHKPAYNDSCEESVFSEDSCENIETHHHHHYVGAHSTDPYYTYDTQPCAPCPPRAPPSPQPCPPCPPTHKAVCDSSYQPCEEAPTVNVQQPVCIADLQSSLSTMISKLN